MREREELLQAAAVTAELTDTTMSEAAVRVLVDDLSNYPHDQVMSALNRCRCELRSRLTLAEIIVRLDDGRPGPEEAWAMIPRDEADSVVWTAEMRTAFGVAGGLLSEGDEIGARMAFKEAYQTQVTKARAERRDPRWEVTLGYNHQNRHNAQAGRRAVIAEAVERGRITHEIAIGILPDYREKPKEGQRQIEGPKDGQVMEYLKQMRELLGIDNDGR